MHRSAAAVVRSNSEGGLSSVGDSAEQNWRIRGLWCNSRQCFTKKWDENMDAKLTFKLVTPAAGPRATVCYLGSNYGMWMPALCAHRRGGLPSSRTKHV